VTKKSLKLTSNTKEISFLKIENQNIFVNLYIQMVVFYRKKITNMIKKRRKTDPNFIMRGLLDVREERASAIKKYNRK